MRQLSLDHLTALIEVAATGSFTAAARRLNLTQPAVSLQIKELEARCRVQLIERSGKTAVPTEAGRELVLAALRIIREVDGALANMRRHSEGRRGRIRMGLSTTTLTHLAAPPLRAFRELHSDTNLTVSIGTSVELADQLRANQVDYALVTLPIDASALDLTPVYADEFVAILPAGHEAPDAVSPEYVGGQPLILEHRNAVLRRIVIGWLTAADVDVNAAFELEHLEAIKGAVVAGLGMSIVPGLLVRTVASRTGLTVCPLVPAIERKLALAKRSDKQETPLLAEFSAHMIRYIRAIGQPETPGSNARFENTVDDQV